LGPQKTPFPTWKRGFSLIRAQLGVQKETRDFKRYETGYYQLNFFSINNLLLPFLSRFIGYHKEEKDLARYDNNIVFFYRNLTLRLLYSSPLARHAPSCSISSTGELTIRAGLLETGFNCSNYTEYVLQATACLNHLLQQDGADVAYYELGFDEDTRFLLLTEEQYQYLFTNRVLRFSQTEYPEVEAWIKIVI
jgi:hypothetical protein